MQICLNALNTKHAKPAGTLWIKLHVIILHYILHYE
jgi:hypothetical protein